MSRVRLIAVRERFMSAARAPWGPPLLAVLLVALSVLLRLPAVLGYAGPRVAHPFNLFEMAHVGAYSDIAHLYFRDRLWLHPSPYLDYRFDALGRFLRVISPHLDAATVPALEYCQKDQSAHPAGITGLVASGVAGQMGVCPKAVLLPVQVLHQFAVV